MNVLYVCADRGIPLLGGKGACVHVRQITAALQRAGHSVTLAVATMGVGSPPPTVERVVELPVDQGGIDELVAAADLVVERYSLSCGPARTASALRMVPYLLEVNAPLVAEAARYRGLSDVQTWSSWQAHTWAAADAVLAVSRPLQALIAKSAPTTPVYLLRNGVQAAGATDRHAARNRLGLQPGQVAIAFVGSMKPWHGVLELLAAFDQLPPSAALLLAGTGPLAGDVRRIAGELGPRARFVGAVPHDEVGGLLAAADIGVAPYLDVPDFYFCPLKVLEYLAAALPVVYSDCGDISEIVGSAGLGVPPGDVPALQRSLQALVDNPDRRTEQSRLAASRVAGQSWDQVATRLLALSPVGTGAVR
ncbi:MAG: glycosyltransferase family 4 protein [Mycobacteriales bacterium]